MVDEKKILNEHLLQTSVQELEEAQFYADVFV